MMQVKGFKVEWSHVMDGYKEVVYGELRLTVRMVGGYGDNVEMNMVIGGDEMLEFIKIVERVVEKRAGVKLLSVE